MFKRKHSGIIGQIQNILIDTPSLSEYPFFRKIVTLLDNYCGNLVVGSIYEYRLSHFHPNEYVKGRFVTMDGESYIFKKIDSLPQDGDYDEIQPYEIEEIFLSKV